MIIYGFWDSETCETDYYLNKDKARIAAVEYLINKGYSTEDINIFLQEDILFEDGNTSNCICCIDEVSVIE